MTIPFNKRVTQSNGDEALLFRVAKSYNTVAPDNPYRVELVRVIVDDNKGADKDILTDLIGIKYESLSATIDALTEAKAAIEHEIKTTENKISVHLGEKKYLTYSDLRPAQKSPLKIL